MPLAWWDIPGPHRFVRRVEDDLRDRVNVVAALPAGLGQDWFNFFRRHWTDGQSRMEQLRLSEGSSSPLDNLCEKYTTSPNGTLTLNALTREPGFRGLTIGLLLDRSDPVQAWMDFLRSYERECRQVEPMDRTAFLVATNGVPPHRLPPAETQLRIHLYDDYARPQDCYMYAWSLLGAEEKQPWRTDLKMALCAQLAQWDPRLCELLSDRDLEWIMRRASSEAALPAGTPAPPVVDLDEGWAQGILQRRNGETVYHSGWLARDATSKEFERRVWTAQVQVVFPLIEQVRHQAIEKYGTRFPLPFTMDTGETITDPYDLEIAKVRSFVSRLPGVPRSVIRRLDQAYDFRNDLAHLRPLTAIQLNQFEPDLDR